MDILTASILSGLIYDGVKSGAALGVEMLKSKLQGWIIDEDQINMMAERLKEAGINEDLAPHAIERKITESQPLLDLLQQIRASGDETCVSQVSTVGHNIHSSGSGNISVGNISVGCVGTKNGDN